MTSSWFASLARWQAAEQHLFRHCFHIRNKSNALRIIFKICYFNFPWVPCYNLNDLILIDGKLYTLCGITHTLSGNWHYYLPGNWLLRDTSSDANVMTCLVPCRDPEWPHHIVFKNWLITLSVSVYIWYRCKKWKFNSSNAPSIYTTPAVVLSAFVGFRLLQIHCKDYDKHLCDFARKIAMLMVILLISMESRLMVSYYDNQILTSIDGSIFQICSFWCNSVMTFCMHTHKQQSLVSKTKPLLTPRIKVCYSEWADDIDHIIFIVSLTVCPVDRLLQRSLLTTQIARFTWPTWGPPGSCRPQVGPMLVPWNLL